MTKNICDCTSMIISIFKEEIKTVCYKPVVGKRSISWVSLEKICDSNLCFSIFITLSKFITVKKIHTETTEEHEAILESKFLYSGKYSIQLRYHPILLDGKWYMNNVQS